MALPRGAGIARATKRRRQRVARPPSPARGTTRRRRCHGEQCQELASLLQDLMFDVSAPSPNPLPEVLLKPSSFCGRHHSLPGEHS